MPDTTDPEINLVPAARGGGKGWGEGGRCLGPNPGPGFWEEAPATASAAADISQNQ